MGLQAMQRLSDGFIAQDFPDGASESLLLRLHSAHGIAQFWSALQAVIHEAAPYDALIVYLNFLDFATSWRAAKILMTPNARRPTPWFEGRRRVDMTPQFVLSQPPGLKLYKLSDVVPDPGELKRTPFFRNYLAPGGWHHLVCQLYWRGNTVCSQIAIRRKREQGDFTPDEIARLEQLHPHIETVLNKLLTLEEERARRRWLEVFNDQLPFALMSLNWELEPVFANKQAFEHCAAWNYGSKDARRYHARAVFHAPAPIISACASLKAQWLERQVLRRGSTEQKPPLTVSHSLEPGLTANITMQLDNACPTANPGFLVHLQSCTTSPSRDSLAAHSMLEGLTPAERELVRFVCQGLGNRDIAEKLGKSVKTVKSQLTSVYKKLNVSSRSRLLAGLANIIH